MQRTILVVMLVVSQLAFGGTPALAPHKGTGLTVSFPKGWTVAEQGGVYVAQQDAKRKDAAAIMFVTAPSSNATEDQLIDVLTAQVAKDVKVVKRAAITGGVGHFAIADGVIDGVNARIAAIAVVISGQAIMCLFAAKGGDFDKLGGLTLATNVLASYTPDAPRAAAPPPPAATPATSGKLTVPPPQRGLTVADIVGEWNQDDHVMTSYVSSSTGAYAGYSAINSAEKWTIDGKGNIVTKLVAISSSRSGTNRVKEGSTGTVSIDANGVLAIVAKGNYVTRYQVRGWEVRPDITVLKLNGPFLFDVAIPDRIRTDPTYGTNQDSYWVRVPAKP